MRTQHLKSRADVDRDAARWQTMVPVAVVLSGTVLLACCHPTPRHVNSQGGDVTIVNARIWTGDPSDPWKSAMTVRNGKIVAMDADDPAGKIIDANKRLVVPGFWDSHCHPHTLYVLTSPEAPLLTHEETVKDVLDRLREYAEEHPEDKYPRMFGWRRTLFKAPELPTRQMLDDVVSDRPVFLVDYWGHAHWANTAALKLAEVFEKDPEILTGHIERDANGLATGFLEETELASTHGPLLASVKKIKPLSFAEQVAAQRWFLEQYPKVGVTSIWTKDGDVEITRIYEQILRQDRLPVRAVLDNLYTPHSKQGDLDRFAERAKKLAESNLPRGFLRADGVKLLVDLPYIAWMFEPYANEPGNQGKTVYPREEIKRQILKADGLGLHVNLLIAGDQSAHLALQILEEVARENPPRERRHSLEHADFLVDEDLQRFHELGVIAVMNPIAVYPEEEYLKSLEVRYGEKRLAARYSRWKDLGEAGAVVAQGSDFPAAPIDPFVGMHLLVNGSKPDDPSAGGPWPHKTISIEEALRSYTTAGAYAAFDEDRLGMLKEGYDADFVMLSENILDPDFKAATLSQVKVTLTVFNGHVLHKDFSGKEKTLDIGG